MRLYKCYNCGGVGPNIIGYKYDAGNNGEDLSFCKLCGAVEDGFEAIETTKTGGETK